MFPSSFSYHFVNLLIIEVPDVVLYILFNLMTQIFFNDLKLNSHYINARILSWTLSISGGVDGDIACPLQLFISDTVNKTHSYFLVLN